MKHTKGPWTLETVPTQVGICHKIGPFPSDGVYDSTHACVYSNNTRMSDLGHSFVGDELLANARLIAAAPEMFDLLRRLCDACSEVTMEREVPYPPAAREALSLISKIEGEDK